MVLTFPMLTDLEVQQYQVQCQARTQRAGRWEWCERAARARQLSLSEKKFPKL